MSSSNTMKQRVQSFGRSLSSMVMPNIGAFIAWGIITALFIETGWFPNERFATIVGPMLTYLLPILIGYTAGKNVYGVRGGVVGAIATMGVIAGADIAMLMGAMIMGPFAAFIIKKFDEPLEGKIPAGFEMLVNNFSAGIIGTILALIGFVVVGPVVATGTTFAGNAVNSIVNLGLLPLVSIVVEPAKVLFLNNAINHGVFGPLGIEQVQATGKSILYLIETNPGPGLGILLAYFVFGKGNVKNSTPSAIIIHFFGGIHEIYFPYVLMNPLLLLAVIAGGASGVFIFNLFDAGLVAAASPGSIIALMGVAARGSHIPILIGVAVSAIVSFVIASFFVKRMDNKDDDQLEKAKDTAIKMKSDSKGVLKNVTEIVYACDAGMGSSAMGASMLKRNLGKRGININVKNYAIDDIPRDASIVVTHEQLTSRAKGIVPNAYHISVSDFLDMNVADTVIDLLGENRKTNTKQASEVNSKKEILKLGNIMVDLNSENKEKAILRAGDILYKGGYVEVGYKQSMLKREKDVSTFVGKGVAMPHGISEDKNLIKKSGVSILLYPEGVDFDVEKAYIIIGIAGVNNEHLDIIARLAEIIDSNSLEEIKKIAETKDVNAIYNLFK